jgi:serine/threonine protein kinase
MLSKHNGSRAYKREHERFASKGGARMPFSGASAWHCSGCAAVNGSERESCFACGQARRADNDEDELVALLHGRYRLLQVLGSGGFAVVYRAADLQQAGKAVAIKQISLSGLSPQEMRDATDTFNREVQALMALQHPHLPHLRHHFSDQDRYYLVMDLLQGQSLDHYLVTATQARRSLLPLSEVLALALQLCSALGYLHQREPPIIFRDLKPANIMRSPGGHFSLIDFGIARQFKPGQVRDTMPLGSPGYAAPEQYGRAQTTPRSDIYGLGALLHFLLSGTDPVDRPLHFAPLSLGEDAPRRELAELVMQMVELDASQRPQSIEEVGTRLQGLKMQIETLAGGTRDHAFGAQSTETELRRDAAPYQEPLVAQRLEARNASRRRFLLAGLTASAALALGAGASLFRPRLFPAAPLRPRLFPAALHWVREFDQGNLVTTVAWSPDGHLFAAGGATNHITVWRTSDGQELTRLAGPDSHAWTWSIAWSPHSRSVASTWNSAWSGNRVRIWNVPSDEHTALWPHERDLILQGQDPALGIENWWPMVIAWSPDGTRLAVGDSSGGLHVVNPSNGQVLRVLQTSGSKSGIPVSSLAWSPDGTSIVALDVAAGVRGRYAIWNTTTGKAMLLPSPNANVIPMWTNHGTAVGWSLDGTTIAASGEGNILVWQWNEKGGGWEHARSIPNPPWMNALTWSPDSQRFATADEKHPVIRIWRASTGQQLGSYSVNPPQINWPYDDGEIRALAWGPDGKHVLSGDEDGRVLLWVVR